MQLLGVVEVLIKQKHTPLHTEEIAYILLGGCIGGMLLGQKWSGTGLQGAWRGRPPGFVLVAHFFQASGQSHMGSLWALADSTTSLPLPLPSLLTIVGLPHEGHHDATAHQMAGRHDAQACCGEWV